MPVIEVNPDLCKRCFTCTQTCPILIFAKKDEESIPEILDDNLQFCLVCGHCVAICPAGAITHDSFPPGSIVPVRKEELPSTEQVMAIPELLSLPANHQIYGALAMGYPKFKYKNWIVRKPAKVEWIV